MKDLYINLQPRTKIQQATNSISDVNKYDNFVDRYRNDKLRVDAESLGISIAIQTRRFSSRQIRQQLSKRTATGFKDCKLLERFVFFMLNNKLKENIFVNTFFCVKKNG